MYRLSYFLDRIWNTSTCQSSLGEQINFLSTKGGCFHKTSRFKILWTCFDILSWSTDVNYFNYLRYSPLRLFVQIRHVDWEKYALEYRTTVETLISSREACCFIKSNFGNVFLNFLINILFQRRRADVHTLKIRSESVEVCIKISMKKHNCLRMQTPASLRMRVDSFRDLIDSTGPEKLKTRSDFHHKLQLFLL